MSILVTGGAGFIGSHAVLGLTDRGEQVVVLDDLSAGFTPKFPDEVTFIEGSIGDRALLADLFASHDIGAIMHFAGKIVVPESVADPLKYYENNVAGSARLVAATVAAGVKQFIFSSSASVYGQPDENPVSEAAALRPESPYGRSKMMTELMLQDVSAAHDFRHVALRYFNVAGADPAGRAGQSAPETTHIVRVAVQAALGLRDGVTINGNDYDTPDGTCIRDYIHITDLIDAHLAALDYLRNGGASDTFNCGYGHGFSVREVVAAVLQESGVDFEVRDGPRRAGDPASVVADTSRITSVLDWTPQWDNLSAMIRHALDWEASLAGS